MSNTIKIKQNTNQMENLKLFMNNKKEGLLHGEIEFLLTKHCNIKCASCQRFSPLADTWFETIDNFTNLINRIYTFFPDNIWKISLLGGEPLLHPDLLQFVEITRNKYKKAFVVLFTNGVLLDKKDEDFFEQLGKYSVNLRVTEYPEVNINKEYIINMCNKYNIELELIHRDKFLISKLASCKTEYNNFKHCKLQGKPPQMADYQINSNGDFYFCYLAATVNILNKYFNLNYETIKNEDYVNIYEINDKKEILSKLYKPIPFCNYCKANSNMEEVYWKKSELKLEEWINDD